MKARAKLVMALTLGLIATLALGGCLLMQGPDLRNAEEAQAYLIDYLGDTYGEPFMFVGNAKEYAHPVPNLYDYSGDYAPVNTPEKVFHAMVSTDGNPTDNYGQWLFKAEVESYCADVCETKDYIDHFTAELEMPLTSHVWKQGDSVGSFLGGRSGGDPYDRVDVWLRDGMTDEEYATQIKDLFDDLYEVDCAVELQVVAEGSAIFFHKISTDANQDKRYTVEDIIDTIESQRWSDEIIQLDRERRGLDEDSE
jgi:hypothetical protein